MIWEPEWPRVANVLEKNARAHVFYENGEPMLEPAMQVAAMPLETATLEYLDYFYLGGQTTAVWPEVGSRWMQRLVTENAFDEHGFYVVQPSVYSFRLDFENGVEVRSLLHGYLAAIVR